MIAFVAQTSAPTRSLALDLFLQENWPIVLPILLAFAALYVLLPRPRAANRWYAGLVAAGALALAGAWWAARTGPLPEVILFYGFAGLAILGAGLMLTQHNPVHAALSFALVVLSSCGLFLLLAAPFLMAATIIVYAGAIVVTFLFVIMLAQQGGISGADLRSREPFLACLAGFILLTAIVCVLSRNYDDRGYRGLAEQLRELAQAKSADEIARIVQGDKNQKSLELVDKLQAVLPKRSEEPLKLEAAVALKDVPAVNKLAQELYDQVQYHGSLPTTEGPTKGTTRRALPAENVASLGNSLFTTYLVPVELAAVLLLVATIGAIAISGRRTEGLR